MLAGIEKALCASSKRNVNTGMNAINSLLEGLIDYAGLYPPAALDMRSAVRNYLSYSQSAHAATLGRFVLNMERLSELREAAGDSLRSMKLSVIASPNADCAGLSQLLSDGSTVDMIEFKTDQPPEIRHLSRSIPAGMTAYFEIPICGDASAALEAIAAAGARAKLRMGGVVAEAFPGTQVVAKMLHALAVRRIPFKATAGLHHPIRSWHPFTAERDGAAGMMHGFVNLCCAAALLHFGGEAGEARRVLDEEDPCAWQVAQDAIDWRSYHWSTEQLRAVRRQFLISFGSCSFVEPMHDLEALGWL